jgi:hypothetical protein
MNSVPQKFQRKEIDPVQLEILEMLPLSRQQKDNLIMLLLSEQEVITQQRMGPVDVSYNAETQEPLVLSCSLPESRQ